LTSERDFRDDARRVGLTNVEPDKHFSAVSNPRKERAMSKVVAIMSMSLDGFVADLNDGVAEVFDTHLRYPVRKA